MPVFDLFAPRQTTIHFPKRPMAQLTRIKELNPDRVPVTVKATVLSLWGSPRPEVAREGRLEDETAIIPFTLWADSPVRDLEKNRKYIFHRAGLGKLDGDLRVEIDRQTSLYPIEEEADVYRTMLKITQQEELERKRYAKGAKITVSDQKNRSRRNIFSIVIAAGVLIWGAVMILQYTELVTEETIRDLFRKRRTVAIERAARKAVTEPREGTVEEAFDGGLFTARVGEEVWTIGYLGLEVPRLPVRKGDPIDPIALQARNFNRFRVGGKTVRLEFEENRLPVDGDGEAYVFEGGKMVNVELLERGLARLRDEGQGLAYGRELREAEESARRERKGVWRE
ncbi:MAG: thermonuclease family protein [Candidatus Erginobacter occultus]|nr:thermonuclease family protein [Candidatus Erginobacter occultus]